MPDWTSVLGYAIAASFLVLPFVTLWLVMRTRWFKRGRRVRWAGERLVHWRDPMSDLGQFGEEPPDADRRRRS
jgi:hypothetical protein